MSTIITVHTVKKCEFCTEDLTMLRPGIFRCLGCGAELDDE